VEVRRVAIPAVTAVLLVMGVMLLAGFFFKSPCIPYKDWHGQQFSAGCYNDIQFLYDQRQISDHVFPVHGKLVYNAQTDSAALVGGAVEYPVLTSVFTWFAGLFANDADGYLIVTAVLLAPFGLLAAYLLTRMTGWRAMIFAAAPAIVLYAFHNWDLLVVAAMIGGIYAWWRGRYGWAAFWLAIGGCLKLFPLFFLAPLLLHRLAAGDRRGALRTFAIGVGTFAAVNLPFVIANPSAWWAPYDFQRLRNADYTSNSIWVWGASQLTRNDLNVLTPALIGLAFAIALAVGWWRAAKDGEYPFVQVCGAMVLAFVLLGKVFSPQYALWIVPFLALTRVRWGWWVAFFAMDVLLYFGLFRWYYDVGYRNIDFGLAKQALIVGIWGKATVVGLLYVAFLAAAPAFRSGREGGALGGGESPDHEAVRADQG
jgi:uncharacterized membrane protein